MKGETWIGIGGAVATVAVATLLFGPLGIYYNFMLAIIGGVVATGICKIVQRRRF